MTLHIGREPRPGARVPRSLSIAAIAVAWLCLLAPPASAIIQDINPNNSDLDATDPDGASGGRVNGLASVPGNNLTFYAASEWGGIFKTTTGGLAWARLIGHLPMATWDVEVDPTNSSQVYATSFYDGRVNSVSGVEVSSDAGSTWTHPATATPPAAFNCAAARRTEPSAFGIGIRPDAASNVFVGTNCGVARSTDSGATWTFVDPTPRTPASDVWDVVVQGGGPTGQGIVDVCGDDGHFRSTDGGTTWTGGAPGLPGGQCSLAVSPDESYVLFASVGTNLFESDDAGATWTALPNPSPQGRIPFVTTNQRSNAGGANLFDLWFGDVSLHRRSCTTPSPPASGGASRCPSAPNGTDNKDNNGDGQIDDPGETWLGPFTRSAGAHDDAGDLVFDTQASNDACPKLFSSDGGIYRNTDTSADCHNPDWEQPVISPHALWLFGMAGANQSGRASEDLYFGAQDNGTFGATNVGALNPTWHNADCCDAFDVAAEPARVLYTGGAFGGRVFRLFSAGRGIVNPAEINTYPADGLLTAFSYAESIETFGPKQYVLLTVDCVPTISNGIDDDGDKLIDEPDENNLDGCTGINGGDGGVYITNDITANPIVWTELGNATEPPSNQLADVQVAMASGTPTFYVQVGGGNGLTADQLWRFTGTNPTGTWTQIDTNIPGGGGVGIFAVNPTNPNLLYASTLSAAGPRMVFSDTAGVRWNNDPELDSFMTGNGAFQYQNQRGPTNFTSFVGYPQPSLLAFDPENPKLLVAGGQDSGVFFSSDGGGNWTLLTDPVNSATSGIAHVPRPRFAYFDHEPADTVNIYLGTQGVGVWRITLKLPKANIGGPYVVDRGTTLQLDGSGSSDPDGQPLKFEWDLNNDGLFDDATGPTPTLAITNQATVFGIVLKVTNPDGGFDTDSTTVLVRGTNAAPIANAGPDQTVRLKSLVTLTGAGSRDPDSGPQPLTFAWTKTAGPTATLTGADTATPTFTPQTVGTYRFRLIVNDGSDSSPADEVVIRVPMLGDLDRDQDVDQRDLDVVLAARNTPANGPNDGRDVDGSGIIDALDARKLTALCSRARCATK